jgi:hypothetical protein
MLAHTSASIHSLPEDLLGRVFSLAGRGEG